MFGIRPLNQTVANATAINSDGASVSVCIDLRHLGDILRLERAGPRSPLASYTTFIAAKETGRAACLIELEQLYCDVIIRRFETFAG